MTDINNKQLNIVEPDYLYRKTEKLVSALYLLTSFISDRDPVKWQIREAGLKLLSQNLPLSDRPIQGVYLTRLILSYLEASYLGGIVSMMNYNILKSELESLIKPIESDEQARIKGAIFPEHFLEVSADNHKGHNNMSNRMSVNSLTNRVAGNGNHVLLNHIKDRNQRQDTILALLKKGEELGIKDFVTSISDCSEKTIQRELASLVLKGLVKKAGEKRWSRYSLK